MKDIARVINNPETIKDIKKPSFDVCMAALMQNGLLLRHINPAPFTRFEYFYLCEAAAKSNPKSITMIQKERIVTGMYENLLSIAVRKDGLALRFIKTQTPELCLEAIKQNPKAILYADKEMCEQINSHCYKQLLEAAKSGKASREKEKKARKRKISKETNLINLCDIEKQTDSLCLKAVKQDGLQLQYVHRQTRKICREAIKQNHDAHDFVRDDDMIWLDDLFGDLAEGMGCFADLIGDYAYSCIEEKSKKIPPALKDRKTQLNKTKYYRECRKALKDNVCNIRHVKPELLVDLKWYTNLCIIAVKSFPQNIKFINKAEISGDQYCETLSAVLDSVKILNLQKCIKYVDGSLLSNSQYFKLIEKVIKADPKSLKLYILHSIDAKEISNIDYYKLCRKVSRKSACYFEMIHADLLSKAQYKELCFYAVKKHYQIIDNVDRRFLSKKDWLSLCKIVLEKKGSFLYYLDVPSAGDRKKLLSIALKNGGGLKYLSRQNYSQCLDIIKKDPGELQYVRPDQFNGTEYYSLCEAAIKKSHLICYIDDRALNNSQYVNLCQKAIIAFPGNIGRIAKERIPAALYRNWFIIALEKSPLWISEAPLTREYYKFCLQAVKNDKNGMAIKEVKYLRLTAKEYETLKKIAEKKGKYDNTENDFL